MTPTAEEMLHQRGYVAVVDRAKAVSPSPQEAQRRIQECLRCLEMLEEQESADVLNANEIQEVLIALADNDLAAALWPMLRRKISLQ